MRSLQHTEVGIQPITATAPGALGSGYRLTPEGVTFGQPVTLTFKYSSDEAAAVVASSLRVATRDARGLWSTPSVTLDAAQRTISVTTTHFSDWSFVGGAQIAPAAAAVLRQRGGVAESRRLAVPRRTPTTRARCPCCESASPPLQTRCRGR